jgi:uncharacterized protein (DUF305 family)
METKPLLYGIIGLFIGGLVVSTAATMEKPAKENTMTMSQMAGDLKDKEGDAYDKAFLDNMIEHHEDAVEMAKYSALNAKHEEVKQLSLDILSAQEKEISQMKQWRTDWGYATANDSSRH